MSDEKFQGELDFNDRYGIRSGKPWLPYAISFAVLGVIWLLWSAFFHAQPAIGSDLIAFNNTDPRNIEIRYIVTREDPSLSGTCILAARDIEKVVVGQITDFIPPGKAMIERVVIIPSRGDAVNARIESCYLN
jgi:hypothetical protein